MRNHPWIALALAAAMCMPLSALAVSEGQEEEAPDVSLELTLEEGAARYLPDASAYAGNERLLPAWADSETYTPPALEADGQIYADACQMPALTPGETAWAQRLLNAMPGGKPAVTALPCSGPGRM